MGLGQQGGSVEGDGALYLRDREGRSSSAMAGCAAPRWASSPALQRYRCGAFLSVESCYDSHYGLKWLIFHLIVLLWLTEHLELCSSKYITKSYSNTLIDLFEVSI